MPAPLVRDARPDEVDALLPLLDQLGHPEDARVVAGRMAWLAAHGDRVLVAELDGRIVGLLTTHRTPVIHRKGDVGRITALVVDERARGTGVGRALMREAESILRAAGCERIEVTSATRRADAHAFYTALGYEASGVRFSRNYGE